ncbi:MAG: hypothetical protein ABL869_02870 [Candidatus Nitrotoga sp.]
MDATDTLLEKFIREWAVSHEPSRFEIVTKPETKGCPMSFHIHPANPNSAAALLWVGDDDTSVSFAVGGDLWWDGGIPLELAPVHNLLEIVALGQIQKQVRKLFGRVVALRGVVGTPKTNHYEYGQLNFFSIVPWLKWETISYQPYFLAHNNDA